MQNFCINISERLRAIADLVREGSVLADVGTDHAFLPIFLLQNDKISSAVAVDINEKPLKIAKEHIEEHGLADRIETFISNGLENVTPKSVDDIVIAGMGGEIIAEILGNCSWIKDHHYHLILQPMTRPEALRKFLYENGFEIKCEKALCEGNKLYIIILAVFSGENANFSDSDTYIGKLSENNDKDTILFLKKTLKSLSFVHKGAVAQADEAKAEKVYDICKNICKLTGGNVDEYCKRDQ